MRPTLLLCAATVLLGACSDREIDLRGTLADGWPDEPLFISAGAGSPPVQIQDSAFALSDIPAGPVDLRIRTGKEEIARINLRDLPGGATLSLERIRLDQKRNFAFPAVIGMEGADVITVNGIRRADPEQLPARIADTGVVLAVSDDADAIILRPQSERLPDLPVVVSPATQVTDASGAVASLSDVSAGHTLRVEGRTESGYLVAERIILSGGGGEGSSLNPGEPVPGERGATSTPARVREREQRPSREQEQVTEQRREREREEKQRDGKRKKQDDKRNERRVDIPKGHRPPPGKCRDWNPNLPPGQQPPPRKC